MVAPAFLPLGNLSSPTDKKIMSPTILLIVILCLAVCFILLLVLYLRKSNALSLSTALSQQTRLEHQALRALGEQQEANLANFQAEQVVLKEEKAALSAQIGETTLSLSKSEELNRELRAQLQQAQQQAHELDNKLVQTETRRTQENQNHQEKILEFKEIKAKLTQEFENLANRIFEEKGKMLSEQHQNDLKGLFNPLKQQIGDFKTKVEQTYEVETRDRVALKLEITSLKDLNLRLAQEALNLTQALKGQSKTQGDWGEMILEKILETSGLTKGREYELQVSINNLEGGLARPDAIIHLPGNRDLVLDAKVSLTAYERYNSSEDEGEKLVAVKDHLNSIKAHIKGLSGKSYQDLPSLRTLDFVLMFIPLESAFLLAHDKDPGLFKLAYDQNILLTSPSTLLVTLRTINNLWRTEAQSQNAQEIALQAGKLLDKFHLFIEGIDDVGRNLERAQVSHEKVVKRLYSGSGNLVGHAQKLVDLGAVSKKSLPDTTDPS